MADPKELVRTLIPDTDAVFGPGEDEHLFDDSQIDNFLTVAGGSITRAAGLAMIAVGNSEALIGKVIKTQDLMTDASKLQDKWRQSGETLLLRADKEDQKDALDFFDIVDFREGWSFERPELTEYRGGWA